MKHWNGHYVDYDYSNSNYDLDMLEGIKGYTLRNIDLAQEHNDISALDYYLPKLAALNTAIEALKG